MAYEKQTWKNGKDGGTPVSADRLNHIEEGIAGIELTPGPTQFTEAEVTKLKALAAG